MEVLKINSYSDNLRRKQRRSKIASRNILLAAGVSGTEVKWQGAITFENEITGDNRIFEPGSVIWDETTLPYPFRWAKEDLGGHKSAVQIGRIDKIWRDGDAIMASGVIFANLPESQDYLNLINSMGFGGVSIDADNPKFHEVRIGPKSDQIIPTDPSSGEPDQNIVQHFTQIRIRGLTAVDLPAFNNAKIFLVDAVDADKANELSLSPFTVKAALAKKVEGVLAKKTDPKKKVTLKVKNTNNDD